jgi:hypothetical protein
VPGLRVVEEDEDDATSRRDLGDEEGESGRAV